MCDGNAFKADLTVAFACEKLGCVLYPGKEYSGKVLPVEIGIDLAIFKEELGVCYTSEQKDIGRYLPKRKADSHKGLMERC